MYSVLNLANPFVYEHVTPEKVHYQLNQLNFRIVSAGEIKTLWLQHFIGNANELNQRERKEGCEVALLDITWIAKGFIVEIYFFSKILVLISILEYTVLMQLYFQPNFILVSQSITTILYYSIKKVKN